MFLEIVRIGSSGYCVVRQSRWGCDRSGCQNETPPEPSKPQQVGVLSRFVHFSRSLIFSSFYSFSSAITSLPASHPLSPLPLLLPPHTMSIATISKPQHNPFSSVPLAHRRHPSAPVVVQPTRTPGLLSIKPQKFTPRSQLPSAQRQHQRSATRPAKAIQLARAQLLEIPDGKHEAAPIPTTPTPASRGRSQAKAAKDRVHVHRYSADFSFCVVRVMLTCMQERLHPLVHPWQARAPAIPPHHNPVSNKPAPLAGRGLRNFSQHFRPFSR